jgi:DNA-binding CsgD family transcriptional regulator
LRNLASAGGGLDLQCRGEQQFALAASGLTTAQIAARLVTSPKTADSHIQHIYTKIGCSTRGAAVLFALTHHLLDHAVAADETGS